MGAADHDMLELQLGLCLLTLASSQRDWLIDRVDTITLCASDELERSSVHYVDVARSVRGFVDLWSKWSYIDDDHVPVPVAVLRKGIEQLVVPPDLEHGGRTARLPSTLVRRMLRRGLVARARFLAEGRPLGSRVEGLIEQGTWREQSLVDIASLLTPIEGDEERRRVADRLLTDRGFDLDRSVIEEGELLVALVPKSCIAPHTFRFVTREPLLPEPDNKSSALGARLRGFQVSEKISFPVAGDAKDLEIAMIAPDGIILDLASVKESRLGKQDETQAIPCDGSTLRYSPSRPMAKAAVTVRLTGAANGYVAVAALIAMLQCLAIGAVAATVIYLGGIGLPGEGQVAAAVLALGPSLGAPLLIRPVPSRIVERRTRWVRRAVFFGSFVSLVATLLIALGIPSLCPGEGVPSGSLTTCGNDAVGLVDSGHWLVAWWAILVLLAVTLLCVFCGYQCARGRSKRTPTPKQTSSLPKG